jgi:hypothetical protein
MDAEEYPWFETPCYFRDTGRGLYPTYHDVPGYVSGRDGPMTEKEWVDAVWQSWRALQESASERDEK